MINYVKGDLFDFVSQTESEYDITFIPHIVNTYGYWASGFVCAVESNCPAAKSRYDSLFDGPHSAYEYGKENYWLLGANQVIFTNTRKTAIINMFAQLFGGDRPLRYNALTKCMDGVGDSIQTSEHKVRIVAPMFGSLRAGGNWDFIEKLVEDCWISRGIDTTIVEYIHSQINSQCQKCYKQEKPLFRMPNSLYYCRHCYSER